MTMTAQDTRIKLLGLGDGSIRKSHYRELRDNLGQLNLYRDMVEMAASGLIFCEQDGLEMVIVNPTARKVLGIKEGQPYESLIKWLARPAAVIMQQWLVDSSDRLQLKTCLPFTGLEVELDLCKVEAESANVTQKGVLCMLKDLSETNRREREELAVRAKLDEIQHLQMMGVFAGDMAEDFNRLLDEIRDCTEHSLSNLDDLLLLGTNLRAILRALEKGKSLSGNLSVLSGGKPKKLNAICARTACVEVVDLLRVILPRAIKLELRTCSEARVNCEPAAFHHILISLAKHSAQSMQSGGTISIHLERVFIDKHMASITPGLMTGEMMMLSIRDNGHGLTQAQKDLIFVSGFTAIGSDLGLASVRAAIESMGGAIQLESEEGKGTVIKLLIPLAEAEAEAKRLHKQLPVLVQETDAEVEKPTAKDTILLVEDDEQMTRYLVKSLKNLGLQANAFTDPELAMNHLQTSCSTYRAVVVDYQLMGMNGLQFAARTHELCPDLPVILTSDIAPYLAESETSAMGILKMLPKPFGASELVQEICDILDKRNNPDKSAPRS